MTSNYRLNAKLYGEQSLAALPLVLLHGWANSIQQIEPLSLQLAAYARVHALDLPGHGNSPMPEEVWGMDEFAESVKKYLDDQGISRAFFVGHSVGGKTLIKLAALYPQIFEKMVLIGASGLRPRRTLKKKLRMLFLRLLRNFIRFRNTSLGERIYRNWYIPRFASRDYLAAGAMTKTFVKIINQDMSAELTSIRTPSLLLWGELDDESPPSVGKMMQQLLANAQLIILPNQGHFPFLGSGAPLVTKYIRDFLFK